MNENWRDIEEETETERRIEYDDTCFEANLIFSFLFYNIIILIIRERVAVFVYFYAVFSQTLQMPSPPTLAILVSERKETPCTPSRCARGRLVLFDVGKSNGHTMMLLSMEPEQMHALSGDQEMEVILELW